jgi:hypothetical protein
MRGCRSWFGIGRVLGALVLGAAFVTAGAASAVQFDLPADASADARLHSLSSGQPGAEWFTEGVGVSGQVQYTSGTQLLELDADLTDLNYFDPNDGGCATDAGSNCNVNFATPLDLAADASLHSLVVNPLGGGFFELIVNFETTGGTDITLTDPTDTTVLFSASWQAGSFLSQTTTGLSASAIYDANTATVLGDLTVIGFANVTSGSYAQLFDSGAGSDLGINLGEFFDFAPTLNSLAAGIIANGTLASFMAEGQGQIFRVTAGDFVPEPQPAVLVGAMLLAGLLWRRRG